MPNDKTKQADQTYRFASRLNSGAYTTSENDFAEVYIADSPTAESESPVSQKIAPPDPLINEIRERFLEMRRFSRELTSMRNSTDRQQAVLFYKQAKFMEDFEDNFQDEVGFQTYYPDLQMMGYEQLRTYYTWRSRVRQGQVNETSYSYVFLYIYELINNIGVRDSMDGMQKLLLLWQEYRRFEPKLDKYMTNWVKDYYIVNACPISFDLLIEQNAILAEFYTPSDKNGLFHFYSTLSPYKFAKSAFYSKENEAMMCQCFLDVIAALNEFMTSYQSQFEDLIFYGGSGDHWKPFSRALYYSNFDKTVKTIKLSDTEIYWYDGEQWLCNKNRVCNEYGRFIIEYIIRRMEQFYRKATGFRHKITASPEKFMQFETGQTGFDYTEFLRVIDTAILHHYRESKKIAVVVDAQNLEKIREDAQATQEKLLAYQAEEMQEIAPPPLEVEKPILLQKDDPWQAFAASLTALETAVILLLLQQAPIGNLHQRAKADGEMLEVLIDSINEKALTAVSDTICEFTDEIILFDEYKDEIERVITSESE